MDYCNGKDLLKTFETLNIDLGNFGPNVIEAWFDTNDLDMINFLNWLTTYLNEDNLVSPHELEQYRHLEQKGLILHDHQYGNALQEINSKYPNICDVNQNIFDVECLEDEIAMCLDEEKRLEQIINLNEEMNKQLSKTLYKTTNEHDKSVINKENAEQNCMKLSQKLDATNLKLHQQILKCSNKLVEFEFASNPSYISNMPMELYDRHYNDVIMYITVMFKEQFSQMPQLESTLRSCKKIDGSIFENEALKDNLSILKHRLFKSIQNKIYKNVTLERTKAELKYLETVNLNELNNIYIKNSSLKFQLETSVSSKGEEIDMLLLELENKATQASEMYVNLPKLHVAENNLKMIQNKFNHLLVLHKKFTTIFSYHILVCLMFMANNADIKQADNFFRAVHNYITYNLHNCQERTDAMTSIINSYHLYKDLPIEESNVLLKALISLISEKKGPSNIKEAIDSFNNLESNRQNLEKQLFCDEFANHRNICKKIEMNCDLLKSFLQSGPTSEYITIPFKLYKTFEKVKDILESQKSIAKSSMQITHEAAKKLFEDKWFKLRRQLWIYFLTEPKKVLESIQQIKAKVVAK